MKINLNSYRTGPDEHGHFGNFGGRFVAETLMPLILNLEILDSHIQTNKINITRFFIFVKKRNVPKNLIKQKKILHSQGI